MVPINKQGPIVQSNAMGTRWRANRVQGVKARAYLCVWCVCVCGVCVCVCVCVQAYVAYNKGQGPLSSSEGLRIHLGYDGWYNQIKQVCDTHTHTHVLLNLCICMRACKSYPYLTHEYSFDTGCVGDACLA